LLGALRERRWRMFWIEFFFDAFGTIQIFGAVTLVPFIRDDFGVSPSFAAWATIGYSIGTASGMLPMAYLGNTLGRKPVLLIGLATEATCLALLFVAPNMLAVAAIRTVEGVANAMTTSSMMAMVQGSFTPRERGKTLGLMNGGQGSGAVLATFIAGAIGENWDWRWLFLLIAPIYATTAVLVAWQFRDIAGGQTARPSIWRFDFAGMAVLAGGLTALVLALQEVRGGGRGLAIGGAIMALAIVAFWAFTRIERRARNPVIDPSLFRSRSLTFGALANALFSFTYGAALFLFPFYLIDGLGWAGGFAGATMMTLSIVRPIVAPISGTLTDRIGTTRLEAAAFGSAIAGSLLAMALGASPPVALVIVAMLLIGGGFGLAAAPNQKRIYVNVPQRLLSSAPGIALLGNHGGRTLGTAFAAMLFTLFSGEMSIPTAFTACMGLLAAVFSITTVTAWLRLRDEPLPARSASG